jgi:hypothetical protein
VSQLLRPGGSWHSKGGLTTIVGYDPAETPDLHGRRRSDVNLGTVLTPALATEICRAVNAARAERGPNVTEIRPAGRETSADLTDLLGEPTPEARAQFAADLAAVDAAERRPGRLR